MSSSGKFGGWQGKTFDPDDVPWDQITHILKLVFAGLAVVAVLWLANSVFYRIDASDEGVVLRFGKKVATVRSGLHTKLPWPIDTVYKVPVQRIQTLEFGFQTTQPGRVSRFVRGDAADLAVAEMLTGDLNLGNVEWIVQYRVKSSEQYLFMIGGSGVSGRAGALGASGTETNPAVPDTIRDVSESVMRKLVGDSSIDYVLTIGRDQINQDAKIEIQNELDFFEAGIEVVTVRLGITSPPTDKVQNAFLEVNNARQRKERVVNEALGERNSKIPAARGARDKAIAEAEGYQNRIILETTGKINAFLAQLEEYEKAPDVTRKRLYLEAMEDILATVGSKTIIDDSVRGILPLLNLDQGSPLPVVERGGQR